jgi:hypothetical protein
VGETLATNHKMFRLARNAGFALWSDPQLLYLMRLEKHLDPTAARRRTLLYRWEQPPTADLLN